jgi:hypothetical protein
MKYIEKMAGLVALVEYRNNNNSMSNSENLEYAVSQQINSWLQSRYVKTSMDVTSLLTVLFNRI